MKQLHTSLLLVIFTLLVVPGTSQIQFIENKDQWDKKVMYGARIPSGEMYIEKGKVTFNLVAPSDYGFAHGHKEKETERHIKKGKDREGTRERPPRPDDHPLKKVRAHAYDVSFVGFDPKVELVPAQPYAHHLNFFRGNDAGRWATNVRVFNEVTYKGIYKGVDVKYFVQENKLKYDIIIAQGEDPSVVQLAYNHVDKIELIEGRLQISTSVNTVLEYIPEAYQIIRGKKHKISCEYVLNGNVVSFSFPEGYNKKAGITIDPVIDFATYSGSTADNWGFTATFDDAGNFYAGGITFDVGYPVNAGSYDATFNGMVDVTISKFSPDGKTLIYSTYLGGSETETPNSMIVNSKGELVIYGVTGSSNYPVTQDAYQKTFNGGMDAWFLSNGLDFYFGTDIFVTVLGKDGDKLTGSTFYGGTDNEGLNDYFVYNYADEFRGEVIIDDEDNIYVSSNTYSSDLPLTTNAFRTTADYQEVCIFKMSPTCNSLTFSSYFGGSLDETGFSLKLDNYKNLFIAGATISGDLPATAGAYDSSGDWVDGFIIKIDSNWQIIRTTYISTQADDVVYLLDIDRSDKIYVTGVSAGNMPVTPGTYNNANSGQYIMKLNNALTTLEWGTVFGKGDSEHELSATAFMVDICGNIYYSGWGGGTNLGYVFDYSITGLPVTADAFKGSTDGSDFYYFILAPDATSLLYATYFGGDVSKEHVDGGTSRFDKKGIIYQGICAGCGGLNDFPTTPGVYSSINRTTTTADPNCNMGAAKISFELVSVAASALAEPSTIGCAPLEVQFTNQGEGDSYFWDLGNGETSTQENTSATYSQAGNYTVTLTATGSGACAVSDTFRLQIEVHDSPVADFSLPTVIVPNQPAKLIDHSQSTGNSKYTWDFGNGDTSTAKEPEYVFMEPGTYNVCLTILDTITGCEDIACKTVTISEFSIVDIPNAFTPNGNGKNDILYVKGEGVSAVRLRIYNRWGELLFESTDMNYGWDGTYKGVPQDMDTYIYYLDAILVNGEEVVKKGNITLIR